MIPFVRPFLPLFDTLLSVTVILPILLALISFTQSLRSQVQSPGIQGQIKKTTRRGRAMVANWPKMVIFRQKTGLNTIEENVPDTDDRI